MKSKALIVEDIQFFYEKALLINNVTFSLEPGEIVALVGPSGIGKSSLLKIIAKIIPPYAGSVSYERLSFMSQEESLLPWRTVLENILLPCELGSDLVDIPNLSEKALLFLKKLNLFEHKDKFPHELSGGMKKLVAFIRTLLLGYPLILLDEPFESIDVALREKLFTLLDAERKEKKTTLFVTHDFRDATRLADRIFLFSVGRIVKTWEVKPAHRSSYEKQGELIDDIRTALFSYYPEGAPI
jgi:ABC-type nitrate/sulfonate/bicarbonate transport system ATPase subunit